METVTARSEDFTRQSYTHPFLRSSSHQSHLRSFYFQIEAVTEGFQTNFTAKQILSELLNVTLPNVNSTQKSPEIFGGDLVIAVNVLVKVADYNAEQGNVSNEEDVKNFVQVASNLLEPVNRLTWQELENVSLVYVPLTL